MDGFPAPEVGIDEFLRIEMRVGRVLTCEMNAAARLPAYMMSIDFGEFGTKTTSAQVTANYQPSDLIGRMVVAVVNLPPKRVAGIKSEVLVLAGVDPVVGTVLLQPTTLVSPGTLVR